MKKKLKDLIPPTNLSSDEEREPSGQTRPIRFNPDYYRPIAVRGRRILDGAWRYRLAKEAGIEELEVIGVK